MTSTETVAATELTRLGEAYLATQHSYDPDNATLRNGAIPLTLLDEKIERWTATEA
jgi:hypothetical protein